jgi:hypothetical protein
LLVVVVVAAAAAAAVSPLKLTNSYFDIVHYMQHIILFKKPTIT